MIGELREGVIVPWEGFLNNVAWGYTPVTGDFTKAHSFKATYKGEQTHIL